jgi:hypothetical protein
MLWNCGTVTDCRRPLHSASVQGPWLTMLRHKDHLTTPSPEADAMERNTVYDAHPDHLYASSTCT